MYIIILTDKDVLNIDNEIQCKLKFKLQYEHLLYSQRRSLMEKQCLSIYWPRFSVTLCTD